MAQILVLNSSPAGDQSVSRLLVQEAVARLTAADPAATVVERDLADEPVPHLIRTTLHGVRGEPSTTAEHDARALSDTLLAELKVADTLVIGSPMHNFSVPTTLRAWFDHVLRPGQTFAYTEAGPKGLLHGKRAILVLARGGLYTAGPTQSYDFQEPYLRLLLTFMGITDIQVVHAEKLGMGPDVRALAIEQAREKVATIVDRVPA